MDVATRLCAYGQTQPMGLWGSKAMLLPCAPSVSAIARLAHVTATSKSQRTMQGTAAGGNQRALRPPIDVGDGSAAAEDWTPRHSDKAAASMSVCWQARLTAAILVTQSEVRLPNRLCTCQPQTECLPAPAQHMGHIAFATGHVFVSGTACTQPHRQGASCKQACTLSTSASRDAFEVMHTNRASFQSAA